jgi:hypothetical protein
MDKRRRSAFVTIFRGRAKNLKVIEFRIRIVEPDDLAVSSR